MRSTQARQTDYLTVFQYHNTVLKHFPHAEGYVDLVKGRFKYVFHYTDHLGNIRLSYHELDSNFLKDGYNIYLFKSIMGDPFKTASSIIDMLNHDQSNLESALEDEERLIKILLFRKEINIEYTNQKGEMTSENTYKKLISQNKSTIVVKTTILKRYQGETPTLAKQSLIDVKNIKLSLTTTI